MTTPDESRAQKFIRKDGAGVLRSFCRGTDPVHCDDMIRDVLAELEGRVDTAAAAAAWEAAQDSQLFVEVDSSEHLSATTEAYNRVAVEYAEIVRDEFDGLPLDRAVLAAFAEYVQTGGSGLVAELGCGLGRIPGIGERLSTRLTSQTCQHSAAAAGEVGPADHSRPSPGQDAARCQPPQT